MDIIAETGERWCSELTFAHLIAAARLGVARQALAASSPPARSTATDLDGLLSALREDIAGLRRRDEDCTSVMVEDAALLVDTIDDLRDAAAQHESDKNWLRAQRDVAEERAARERRDEVADEDVRRALELFEAGGISPLGSFPAHVRNVLADFASKGRTPPEVSNR